MTTWNDINRKVVELENKEIELFERNLPPYEEINSENHY